MRFPRQHHLVQHLIARYKLPVSPFPIHAADTFIYLNGKRVRRSELIDTSFALPPSETSARSEAP